MLQDYEEKKLNDILIGSQLIDFNEDKIVVKKDNKIIEFEIDTDQGDCCGYSDIETNLYVDLKDCKRNPVITKVSYTDDRAYDYEELCITLFGEKKELASLNSTSGSGSGWGYGAFATLNCKLLDIDFELTSW